MSRTQYEIENDLKELGTDFDSKRKRYDALIKEQAEAKSKQERVRGYIQMFNKEAWIRPISDDNNIYPAEAWNHIEMQFANEMIDSENANPNDKTLYRFQKKYLTNLKEDLVEMLKSVEELEKHLEVEK